MGVTRKEFAKREEVGLGGRSLAVATGRIALVNVPRVAVRGESGANARNPAKEVRCPGDAWKDLEKAKRSTTIATSILVPSRSAATDAVDGAPGVAARRPAAVG